MNEPTPSGFDQPGLADIFKVQYQGPSAGSAPTSSPRSSRSRTDHRTAIIVGCLVGGIACLTLVVGLGLCYMRQLRHRITGSQSPSQETYDRKKVVQEMDSQENFLRAMDNQERVAQEMDNHENFVQELENQENFVQEIDVQERVVQEMGAKNICWELSAENKPVEMWSSTERSEEGHGSGHFRRSWGRADKKVPEVPSSGNCSDGSSGESQRSF